MSAFALLLGSALEGFIVCWIYGKFYYIKVNCLYTNRFLLRGVKGCKNQESLQSTTTPDPGHHMGKSQNTKKHHIQDSQEVSPFLAGDHKAAMNRQESITKTKHKYQKLSTKEALPWKGQ